MKRDMDLVRKILFEVEKEPFSGKAFDVHLDGYTVDEINYNVMLLKEAGLIETKAWTSMQTGSSRWKPVRLTWEGHEFLDAARDNARWEKAKNAMSQAGGFALDVMKQLLIQYLKEQLKLP